MATVQQLIDDANRVIAETQQGGNTQSRIGNLYLGIIDFIDILDRRTIDGYEYDDTALKEAIRRIDRAIENLDRALDDALAIATQERDRLDNLVNELDQDIENKVNRMLDDASTLQDHASTIRQLVNEGEIYWKSEWDANIEAYLQEVGVWAREGDVIKTQWSEVKQDVSSIQSTVAEVQTDLEGRPTSTQWSQITQKVNSIEQSVNSLVNDGDVTEALQSSINQSIENGIAKLSLETVYAKKDVEGSEKLLEWMYAALKNSTTSTMTYAELVAAGESGLNNAIADVRTCVTTITNGDYLQYVSETSMETKVNDVVTGLYSKATASESSTNIFSQVKKDSTDISEIVVHCTGDYSDASIATKFDKFRAGLVLHADLESAKAALLATVDTKIGESTAGLVATATLEAAEVDIISHFGDYTAGFLAKSDLKRATAEMFAKDDVTGIVAAIFAEANKNGSSITLKANQINMNASDVFIGNLIGNTAFLKYLAVDGDATFYGNIHAKELVLDNTVSIEQGKITGLTTDLTNINNKFNNYTTTRTFNETLATYNDKLDGKLSTDALSISDASYDSTTGLYKRTITFNGNEYTELTGGDFIIHNIGTGTDPDVDNTKYWFKVETSGLLRANNAIIRGTIYANKGEIAGWKIDTDVLKHSSDSVGLYSGSDYNPTYNDSAVRFWAGGYSRDAADFRVTKDGSLYASKASIIGDITASSGSITGEMIVGKYGYGYNSIKIIPSPTNPSIIGYIGTTEAFRLGAQINYQDIPMAPTLKLGYTFLRDGVLYLSDSNGDGTRLQKSQLVVDRMFAGSHYPFSIAINNSLKVEMGANEASMWPKNRTDVSLGKMYLDGDVVKVRLE